MKICIIPQMYPNKYSSSDFVFVKMLVDEFARQGHECVVVCPHSFLHYRHFSKGFEEYLVDGNKVRVICPNYLSMSTLKIGNVELTELLHRRATRRALKRMKFKPDVVYCHFWSMGYDAYPYAKKHQLPLFVASGECEIFLNNKDGKLTDFCEYVRGVICVSTKNKDESVAQKLTVPSKCEVFPNSIDNMLFFKKDKVECRKKLGIPIDKFTIAFVGWFEDRKGCLRVAEAIDGILENDVYSLFIGSGSQKPECNNILFMGKVKHDELPVFLNAADAFVLPTLQEGCCNAVVEATACGLPIISSNLQFNWDVLNSSNSIMVDPNDVLAIRNAIIQLRDNHKLREHMSQNALNTAENLNIQNRASKILNFISNRI